MIVMPTPSEATTTSQAIPTVQDVSGLEDLVQK